MNTHLFHPRNIACPNCGSNGVVARAWGSNRLEPSKPLRVVTCAGCGLCFLNPQYPPQAYEHFYTHAYFDEMGADFTEQSRALTRDYRTAVQPILSQYLRDLPQDGIFADIGAGSGTWLEIFKEIRPAHSNANIVAIEPSGTACDDLARRYPGLNIFPTTLERSCVPQGSLDAVLCSALIEHFSDPLVSLLHMNELLKPGGLLIMLTPSLEQVALRRGAERFFKFVHTFYYTGGTLNALAHKAGFSTVHSLVVPPQRDSLLWFPLLVTIHRKEKDASPADVFGLRRPAASDAENLREAEALFGKMRWAFARENACRSARRMIKTALKLVLKNGR